MSTIRIYVGNLPFTATSQDLRTFFGPSVTNAHIITDRDTRKSRGFGFVELQADDVNEVIAMFDGIDFGGRTIRVREADPKPPRTEAGRGRREARD